MAKLEGPVQSEGTHGEGTLEDRSGDLWNPAFSDVRRRLLTSAVRCFAANGYHGTTTRDISSGVGLSPAALYVHFSSKELVLYEIIRSGHERALAHLLDPTATSKAGPGGDLGVLMARYTAWHARHHVAARVCQYQHNALSSEHYDDIKQLRRRTSEVFRRAVARVVEEESFAPIDVNRVARAMMSLSIDLVRWYRLDGCDSPQQLGRFYADLALTMVLQRPPAPHDADHPSDSPGRSR